MKERFRRIPIELIISPAYEDRTADARLAFLSLIISPRQTPPGVYDGGIKSLEYETALPASRLKDALKELEAASLIEHLPGGGWWVRDTFRAQCCNADYARAALRHLKDKWSAITTKFIEANRSILEKHEVIKDPPQRKDRSPSHPPQSPTGSEAVTGSDSGTEKGSETGTGDRGLQGEGGVVELRTGAFRAPSASTPDEKGNGAGMEDPLPPSVQAIFLSVPELEKRLIEELYRSVLKGKKSASSAREILQYKSKFIPPFVIDRLFPGKAGTQ